MKKILLSTSLMALCFAANAQSSKPVEVEGVDKPYAPLTITETKDTTEGIFTVVEQMPQPPVDIQRYLASTVRYPNEARKKNIQGRVIAKFVVEKDGSVSNTTIVRGIGGGCDEETLRVINAMPKWKPGYQNGKPVRVYYVLPVMFKLTD